MSKVNNWSKIFKYFASINYLTLFLYLGETDEYGWPVHDYESGLSGAIMDIYRDGENMYKSNFKYFFFAKKYHAPLKKLVMLSYFFSSKILLFQSLSTVSDY